jgi:hypothetical protein
MAGYIFSSSEAKRVADTVRANEGEVQRRLPPRPRPFVPSGGGGSSSDGPITIRFTIIYAIPSEQYAVCFPLSVPDGYTFGVDTNLPGADDSGQITIYDRVGCFLDDNDPAAFIDRDGYAIYLRSQTTTECEDAYSSGGLGWEMTHLCCDTTVCEG